MTVTVMPGGAGGQLSVGETGVPVKSDQVFRGRRGLAWAKRPKPDERSVAERRMPMAWFEGGKTDVGISEWCRWKRPLEEGHSCWACAVGRLFIRIL